jgi:hypothetical protein
MPKVEYERVMIHRFVIEPGCTCDEVREILASSIGHGMVYDGPSISLDFVLKEKGYNAHR